ncbi:MAG: hypothetical protein DWG80_07260 [Chloroflexi bacterium]|nr:zinc ribbon domain-containing protein [Chloroflexota bacterium]MQC18855.1 hypothetical protein [Chloroflexota bacterium]
MPYIVPVPDEVSKPFWDAVQERRLIVQHCNGCNTLQYPPKPRCQDCNSEDLGWKDASGKGHILTCGVLQDSHLPVRAADQPLNLAVVTLDEDPRINFYSNLPGTPPFQVEVGAAVEVTYVEAPDGSLIHEWRVVD